MMNNIATKDQAIRNIYSEVTKVQAGKSFTAFSEDGNEVLLNTSLVDAEISRLQAEYDSKQYARDRKVEYAMLNQFEMQFDDQRDSTTTWVDAVNAIKAQFPKPS